MTKKPEQDNKKNPKRVLVIAESDSNGAGGIQGDTKTILALGGYAATAITALTAHTSNGILSVKDFTPSFVGDQINAVMEDIGADAIKIGFLKNEEVINIVADAIDRFQDKKIPIIMDPSIVDRTGKTLIDNDSISALKRRLYFHTNVLTPNLKEAEMLGVMHIADIDDMRHAADMMRTLGVENVILKGGQVDVGKELYFVATADEERIYQRDTLQTRHTLGAGSAFSSAIALNMAKQVNVFDAVEHALDFLHQAILHSNGFGHAEGPINHAFHIQNQSSIFHPEEIKLYKI